VMRWWQSWAPPPAELSPTRADWPKSLPNPYDCYFCRHSNAAACSSRRFTGRLAVEVGHHPGCFVELLLRRFVGGILALQGAYELQRLGGS
jgi:hypothetical protein